MNRREFLISSSAIACACLSCPNLATAAKNAAKPVDVGPLSELPDSPIVDRWAETDGFCLIRRSGRLYAVSAFCTHKRVRLVVRDEKLKCPRHGSVFETNGEASKGPAKDALPRLSIRLDDRGHILVDPSKRLTKDQWAEPEASIVLEAGPG